MTLEATQIVLRPVISEKSMDQTTQRKYTFAVADTANKMAIKSAVEELYGVRVVSVATQIRKGETRRRRHGYVTTGTVKRAIVKIHPEDSIQLF